MTSRLQAVNSGWQKPLKLALKLIKRYGQLQGGWVLDGFCGSGVFTHAAILSGMSAYCFDSRKDKIDSTLFRAEHFRAQPSAEEELISRAMEVERQKEEEEEEEDENMDGDNDDTQAVASNHAEFIFQSAGADVEDDSQGPATGADGVAQEEGGTVPAEEEALTEALTAVLRRKRSTVPAVEDDDDAALEAAMEAEANKADDEQGPGEQADGEGSGGEEGV